LFLLVDERPFLDLLAQLGNRAQIASNARLWRAWHHDASGKAKQPFCDCVYAVQPVHRALVASLRALSLMRRWSWLAVGRSDRADRVHGCALDGHHALPGGVLQLLHLSDASVTCFIAFIVHFP
jgi:hypothetical protein